MVFNSLAFDIYCKQMRLIRSPFGIATFVEIFSQWRTGPMERAPRIAQEHRSL
jgi:hypothetical protein